MSTLVNSKFVRSEEGWIAGVCQGLGESFDIPPGMIRVLWLISVLVLGIGLIAYFIAAFSFPVRGREHKAMEPKLLGVCLRIAKKFEMDVGLVRFLGLLILISSCGTTVIGYIILHFLIPDSDDETITIEKG